MLYKSQFGFFTACANAISVFQDFFVCIALTNNQRLTPHMFLFPHVIDGPNAGRKNPIAGKFKALLHWAIFCATCLATFKSVALQLHEQGCYTASNSQTCEGGGLRRGKY